MDRRIRHWLRCPICGHPLTGATEGTARTLACPHRHSFDIARQGYVNLLAGRAPHAGDTGEMVAARADFLAAGHYDLISRALTSTLVAVHPASGCRAPSPPVPSRLPGPLVGCRPLGRQSRGCAISGDLHDLLARPPGESRGARTGSRSNRPAS